MTISEVILNDGEKIEGRLLPVYRPPRRGEAELYIRHARHYVRDVGLYVTCLNESPVSDYIPAAWGQRPCPFCRRWMELQAEMRHRRGWRRIEAFEHSLAYKVSVSFLFNVRTVHGRLHVLRLTTHAFPQLVELAFGSEYSDLLELEKGRDVIIRCKGVGILREYTVLPANRTYTVPSSVLACIPDLRNEISVFGPDVLRDLLPRRRPDVADAVNLRALITRKKKGDR